MMKINNFSILEPLGKGGYGEIYLVTSEHIPGKLALKTENIETTKSALRKELEILKQLPKENCFPNVLEDGQTSALYYYVMPFYGPSLQTLQRAMPERKFSLNTTIRIAHETLDIIKTLHSSGFVHCDIKPSNFLLNQHNIGGFVLIDYGLSAMFSKVQQNHSKRKRCSNARGTVLYASTHVLQMEEPTKRDDVISWFYSLIEMRTGHLPWEECENDSLILPMKQTITPEKLCAQFPSPFISIYQTLLSLKFEDDPPYDLLHQKLTESQEISNNVPFDWEENPSLLVPLTPFPELFDPRLEKPQVQEKPKKKRFLKNPECQIL